MAIEAIEFDLSMTDVDTGAFLTGYTYNVTVTDADGVTQTTLRNLSIAQLVMAICLERAVALEQEIINTMNSLNRTSTELQNLTEIETAIVAKDGKQGEGIDLMHTTLQVDDQTYTYYDYLTNVIGLAVPTDSDNPNKATANSESTNLINDIEQAMDKRNSINQQTMIELQSATGKRNQAYDMIANISKSLSQVQTGIVNNM